MTEPYQLFDALPSHIEDALRASIQRFGVLVPVYVDQDGNILDGNHRKRIAEELKVPFDRIVRYCEDEEERHEIARTLNADRRQLTEEQRRKVAADLFSQGHSERAVAAVTGVSPATAHRLKNQATASGEAVQPERTKGLDGKSRPARRAQVWARSGGEQERAQAALTELGDDAQAKKFGMLDVRKAERAAREKEQGTALDQHQARMEDRVAKDPQISRYLDAVKSGELQPSWWSVSAQGGGRKSIPELSVKDVSKTFTGQPFTWPRYTGAVWVTGAFSEARWDEFREDLSVPLFTEEEWEEFTCTDPETELEALDFPGSQFFRWKSTCYPYEHPTIRRTYEPGYGCFFVEDGCERENIHSRGPTFVRRGWGEWRVIEFHDGDGGREERRLFQQDHACDSFVKQAYETVDPLTFSQANIHQLAFWKAAPVDMSWAYVRHRTIDRDAAVAALRADADRIEAAERLDGEELTRRAAAWLQDYTPPEPYMWREGHCAFPRRPDGTVDKDAWEQVLRNSGSAL